MKYIIALVGKAGAGKDAIMHRLCQAHPDWNMIVSCTTRPKREGEVEGINYYYLTNEEFAQKVLNGDMLEATYFNNWHYGTMASSLKDGINIGVFNPEGYDCLKEIGPSDNIKVIGFYITCDDKTRLLRQLNRENDPNVGEIIRRFSADEEDFYDLDNDPNFPITIISNDKDKAILDVVLAINNYIEWTLDVGHS
jgi:guanylate kinase